MAAPLRGWPLRGPGAAEAGGVLLALVLLELAAVRLLPVPASRWGQVALIGGLRLGELALCLGYWRARGWHLEDLGLRGRPGRRGLALGCYFALGFGALVGTIEAASRLLTGTSPLQRLVGPAVAGSELMALLVVGALVAPAFEELVFRGILYGGLRSRLGPALATAAVTVLFALAHLLAARIPWVQAVGGVLFCLAYEVTGSLWAPMLIHACGNLALFLLPHLLPLVAAAP